MGITTKIGAFVAGFLLVQHWRELPTLNQIIIFAVFVAIFWRSRHWHMMLFVIAIIWMSLLAQARISQQLPFQLEGQDIAIVAIVTDLPQTDGYRTRFDVRVLSADTTNIDLPMRLRLTWYNANQTIQPGQQWQFTVRLKRPRGMSNPGGFDYEAWLFSQNFAATGYIRKHPASRLIKTPTLPSDNDYWRQQISTYLDQQLPQNDFLGIVKALAIGDRQLITKDQWQLLRSTGTVHIVAISGLHIGLVSGLVFFLVWRLSARLGLTRLAPPSLAALCAMTVGIAYAALAGFSLPTQRALLMLLVAMICVLRQRHYQALNVLALALLVVLVIDPLAILSAGLWLSFSAVFLIIFILDGRLQKPPYWLSTIKVNGLISLGLSPLLVFFFQQFSLIAPIANFIAIPLMSLWIVPMLLGTLIVNLLSPEIANLLLTLAVTGIQVLMWLLAKLAEFEFASQVLAAPPLWAVLLASIGCLILFMPRGLPGRYLGLILLLPALLVSINRPAPGQIKLTLLDVGQGLSVVITTAKHVLVYDTGARFSQKFDIGERVILPFLQAQNINAIDLLLISHSDNDHIGGAASLLQQTQVKQVLTSVPTDISQVTAKPCLAGQTWVWDQVTFTLLAPTKQRFPDKNNNSCVLRIESSAGVILLTGDIEQAAEAELVANYRAQLKADIMIAPHHGSNTSSTLAFLQAVQPETILIPAGYRNRFKFPHAQVLARYQQIGANWMTVGELGAITVEQNQQSWSISHYRASAGRYWHQ